MIEITLIILILIASLALIRINFLSACVLALVLSTFLHKELFSLYIWDLLPIRILMSAFLLNSIYEFFKFNGLSLKFVKYLKDPIVIFSFLFIASKLFSTINSLDIKTSIFLDIFYISVFNFILTIYFKLQETKIYELYEKYIKVAFLVSLIPFIQLYLYFSKNYLFGAILNVAGVNVDFPSFSFNPGYFMDALKLIVMTRLGSIFWDVNHFGGFLAGLWVPALAFGIINKGKVSRNFYIYFIFISSALFLTNSRSAWILGFVSLLTFLTFVIYRKIGKKGVLYSILGFTAFSFLLFTMYQDKNSFFREKVRSYFHYRMDSFDSHFLLLQGAVDVFNKYPLIGGGTGSFFEHFKETQTSNEFLKRDPAGLSGRVPAHSIWGEVLAENGAFGVFVFVSYSLFIIAIFLYATIHSSTWQKYFLYSSFLGSMLGWLIAGIFYSYNSEFFFLLFLLPVIYVVKNEKIKYEELFNYFKVKNYYLSSFLFLISLTLLLFSLGTNKLVTFDESIYAKVSKNMFETGDLFSLTWRSTSNLWFEKPPLFFIVTSYFYKIFGVTEFATRIGVVIFSLVGLIYTYKLAKLIFNSAYVGIFSFFGLILNVSYLYYSRIGMLDVMLSSLIVSSVYYFLKYEDSYKKSDLILSGGLIGLSVMTKSILGLIPFLIIGIYFLYSRLVLKKISHKITDLFLILLFAAIVSLPWHVYMYYLYGEKFIKSYIEYHLVERYSTAIEDKGAPWNFYIVVIRNTMRLWFLILIPAFIFYIYRLFKKQIPERSALLLFASLIIMVLFSSSSSKLKWYIMPIYPFLYIICGYFVYSIFNFLVAKKLSYQILGLAVYSFIFLNLAYLYSVRDMVYTYDFNFKQASLITRNNSLPNIESSYFDKIDYPVGLFYNEQPKVSYVQYNQLRGIIEDKIQTKAAISIITGASRFENLKREFPELMVIDQNDDFVLATVNLIIN